MSIMTMPASRSNGSSIFALKVRSGTAIYAYTFFPDIDFIRSTLIDPLDTVEQGDIV